MIREGQYSASDGPVGDTMPQPVPLDQSVLNGQLTGVGSTRVRPRTLHSPRGSLAATPGAVLLLRCRRPQPLSRT